jgi:hypothetical protein
VRFGDTIATEIVKRCTGEATVDAIVDDLAQIHSATRGRILADVNDIGFVRADQAHSRISFLRLSSSLAQEQSVYGSSNVTSFAAIADRHRPR